MEAKDWITETDENEKGILYGREYYGIMVGMALKKFGIDFDLCVAESMDDDHTEEDKQYIKKWFKAYIPDVTIIGSEVLKKNYDLNKTDIIFGVPSNLLKRNIDFLQKLGIEKIYFPWSVLNSSKLDFDESEEKELYELYKERHSDFIFQENCVDAEGLYLVSVDATVTERCSLKCRDCSNLMQYYKNPRNLDVDELINDLHKLIDKADRIGEIRIIGGEPFMNKEFTKIIEEFKNENKVRVLGVWSNGTIFPPESVLESLKDPKVRLRLSDYGELSRELCHWKKWCDENNVEYKIVKYDLWQNVGHPERHDYSEFDLKYKYSTCECRNLPTLFGGRLYNCPYVANAANLGVISEEEIEKDSIVINENTDKKYIDAFLYEREFLEGCNYCNGRNFLIDFIPEPAIQIKQPLPYSTYEKTNPKVANTKTDYERKISVIIPVYNMEKYVAKCLHSILEQTYGNLEIMVIDDGSTDNTLDICRSIEKEDKRVRILVTEHQGTAHARNVGIKEATGDFVGFVDADDWIDKNYYEKLVANIRKSDIVMNGFISENVCKEEQVNPYLMDRGQSRRTYEYIGLKNGVYDGEKIKLIWKYMFVYNSENIKSLCYLWNNLFRMDLMKRVYKYIDERIYVGEDTVLLYSYLIQCQSVTITGILGYHRLFRPIDRYFKPDIMCNLELFRNNLRMIFKGHKEEKQLMERLDMTWYSYSRNFIDNIIRENTTALIQYPWGYNPYYGRLNNKKIIIYGAGNVGKMLRRNLTEDGECTILMWVDNNYAEYKEQQLDVKPVKDILTVKYYDYIIIGVGDKFIADQIKKELLEIGIDESKLLWNKIKWK